MSGFWVILVSGVALALLPLPRGGDHRWRTAIDLPLALGLGALAVPLALWLSRFHIDLVPVTASDFGEYCNLVTVSGFGIEGEVSNNRSRLLSALLGRVARGLGGPLDGFFVASALSCGVIASSAYVWARALHSRCAGVVAALIVPAVAPLAVAARMYNFYPEVTAICALSAATAGAAARWRSAPAVLSAGIGAGLVLLVDLRGLLFALPCVGIALAAVLWGPGPRPVLRSVPLRALCLALPLALAWFAGPLAYPADTAPLESQADLRRMLRDRGYSGPQIDSRVLPPSTYIWGHTPLTQIPSTLTTLKWLGDLVPEEARRDPVAQAGRVQQVDPWRAPTLCALALAAWGLRRRPWLFLVLLGTSLPFAVSLKGAVEMQFSQPRFLVAAAPFLPVLLGVGFASLARGALPWLPFEDAPDPGWRGLLRPLACGALALALTTGALQSSLSPVATWRVSFPPAHREIQAHILAASGAATKRPTSTACVAGVQRELAAGGPHYFPAERVREAR